MKTRERLLRGTLALGSGQVLGQGFALLRNVIVARMVTTADYGIASTFMVTVQLLESLSDRGRRERQSGAAGDYPRAG